MLIELANFFMGGKKLDYKALALEFIQYMHLLRHARPQKELNESMQGEAFVIQYLSHNDGSILPSEISNIMGISTARIAATLNSLERKGLVTRRIDTNDRRRILVDITLEGKALAEEQHEFMLNNLIKLLSLLDDNDAKEYVRITGKLAELASQHKVD